MVDILISLVVAAALATAAVMVDLVAASVDLAVAALVVVVLVEAGSRKAEFRISEYALSYFENGIMKQRPEGFQDSASVLI